jgi:tRNA-2-methylthio-N6-dimethylallyladenosine synthase
MAMAKYHALVGQEVEILVEGPSHRNAARYEGRTRSNKIVVFEGSPRHVGELLRLRIERAGSFTLYGNPAIIGFEDTAAAAVNG